MSKRIKELYYTYVTTYIENMKLIKELQKIKNKRIDTRFLVQFLSRMWYIL